MTERAPAVLYKTCCCNPQGSPLWIWPDTK